MAPKTRKNSTEKALVYLQIPAIVEKQCKSLIHGASIEEKIEETDVSTCDVILAFCPVVSRLGTDVEAALKTIPNTNPCILAVMHFTIDPDYVAPDSKKFARGENVVIIDCLFSEDEGLLKCSKNDEAIEHIKKEIDKYIKDSDSPLKFYIVKSEDDKDKWQWLEERLARWKQINVTLKESVKESDIIFCMSTPEKVNETLKKISGDKPCILLIQAEQLKVVKVNKPNVFVVNCFVEEDGVQDIPINENVYEKIRTILNKMQERTPLKARKSKKEK